MAKSGKVFTLDTEPEKLHAKATEGGKDETQWGNHTELIMMMMTIVKISVFVCVCVCALSHVQLFATPWIVARQAPPPMELSKQEYWSGLLVNIHDV